MPTKYSPEGQLLYGLEYWNMPVGEFAKTAALDGIRGASKTRLNEAFRDATPLDSGVALKCLVLWREIEGFCKEVEPLKLDLRDGEQVYQWLLQRRAGELNFSRQEALLSGMMAALDKASRGELI